MREGRGEMGDGRGEMGDGRGEMGERCMKMGEIEEALVYAKARKRHLSILRSPFSSLPSTTRG